MSYTFNPFTGELDNVGSGGTPTPVSASVKADTITVVQDTPYSVTFATAFATGTTYVIEFGPIGGSVTAQSESGFTFTPDDTGITQYIATKITE